MIGVHAVTVTPTDAGAPVDISCLIDDLSIVHGRDNVSGQPDASTATLNLSFNTMFDDLPPAVDIGAVLTVKTTLAGTAYTRFAGPITDLVLGWDERAKDTPNSAVMQILAAGPLAALGRRVVGDAPFPQELDGARVSRVLALAGVTLNPATSDPGTVQILARDVDAQPALGIAQEPAASASGLLWQTRAGEIRYADAEHRRGAVPVVTIDSCNMTVTPTWRRDTSGLINEVSIGYGVAPEGGTAPRYTAENTPSQDRYGTAGYSISTVLAALADAQAMGNLVMTRNAAPVWLLQRLPLAMEDLNTATTAAVLTLDIHDLVGVTGMPAIGALPTTTSLWVEGWTETLGFGIHDLELYVSGYCRTSPPPRWNDVPTALTWNTVDPAMTWNSAVCMGPLPSEGRWDDVPASVRWDNVPPTTTWNTWEG